MHPRGAMRKLLLGSLALLSLVPACSLAPDEEGSSADALGTACEAGGACSDRPLDPRSPWPKFRRDLRQDGRSPVCRATSVVREQLGSETLAYFRSDCSEDLIIVKMPGLHDAPASENATLFADAAMAHVFGEDGLRIR